MKKEQNTNSIGKTYKIATRTTTYMVFAILLTLLFYIVAFFAPALINVWGIAFACILYGVVLLFLFIKGEKLIITKGTIQIKGLFSLKKINIHEIERYKVMASSYTGGNKIITLYTKGKNVTINSIPSQRFSEFVTWLENELEQTVELKIDPSRKLILKYQMKSNPTVLNQTQGLKIYDVGKRFFTTYLIFCFFILLLTFPMLLVEQNYISSQVLMYVQTIGGLLLMASIIIYTMFIHNKLTIFKDALHLKGLLLNKELKFHEIKGFKIEQTLIRKRLKCIKLIAKNNSKKNMTLRPTAKISFVELTDWIENNFTNLKDH